MFKFILFNFFFISLIITTKCANYLERPESFIVQCKLSMPDFDDCLKRQTQSLFNQLSKGIPGLKKLRPIDPYYINKIKFNQGSGNIAFKSVLTNIKLTGFKNINVQSSTLKYKNFATTWYGEFLIPKLRFDLDFDIDGRILVVPLKGKGKMVLEMDNVKTNLLAHTYLYEKYGHVFCNVTDVVGDKTDVTGIKVEMQNLFNGNVELERATNEFFNENWREIFEVMKPLSKRSFEEIIHDIIKKIYAYVPSDYFIEDLPIPPPTTKS